jgi:hypothetical protein
MTDAVDPNLGNYLEEMTADIGSRVEDRRKDKWPDYRETDSSAKKREILVSRHQRMAVRWARVWVPIGADREIRSVETVVADYLDRREQGDGGSDADQEFRQTLQGLTDLGNALSKVLRAVQGSNRDARLAAIDRIGDAVERGEPTSQILADAVEYQPLVRVEEVDDQDVRD